MRPQKSAILIALVALLLTALVAVMGQQTPVQGGDQKKTESCCCKDSCPMMKNEGTTANADAATANAEAKHDCCGDSCDMKKDGMTANADAATAGADAKHDCCGDSCDMANHANGMAKHDKHDKKMHAADGSCCKMKSKDAKQKDAKEKTN